MSCAVIVFFHKKVSSVLQSARGRFESRQVLDGEPTVTFSQLASALLFEAFTGGRKLIRHGVRNNNLLGKEGDSQSPKATSHDTFVSVNYIFLLLKEEGRWAS
jgi:hypothetical protein